MKTNRWITLASAALLAGCATAVPYQPLTKDGYGYSEQKLEDNRYRVSFTGNSATPRETVENYMMYRAAEITQREKCGWFVIAGRDTRTDPQRSRDGSSVGIGLGSGGFGSGVSIGLGTVFGAGGGGDAYYAQADILVHKGDKPADNPAAFAASEVLANLKDSIRAAPPPPVQAVLPKPVCG